MGYVVLHLDKAQGSDSKMSSHIERKNHPENADATRTHLNRELIDFPEGVENRTQAIQHRIENADISRKVGTNQVRAIRILLSGSAEDMAHIEKQGKLNDWCSDNIDWVKKIFGADNLVSAVLHMDELTPHIHATVIPIVRGERRKTKQENEKQDGKKKYRKKNKNAPRLCADDVVTRDKLKEYQNSYAEAMQAYGLQRGIDGSEARHISTAQYYRDIFEKKEVLQEDVERLVSAENTKRQSVEDLRRQEQEAKQKYEQAEILQKQKESALKEAEENLSLVKGQLKTEKLKSTAADVGSTIMEGIGSVLGTSKVKHMQKEIDILKTNNTNLTIEVKDLKQKDKNAQTEYTTTIDKFKVELEKIHSLFPKLKELLRIENLCRHVGFGESLTKMILEMKPIGFKGKLYSSEYQRHFETEQSEALVKQHPTDTNSLQLTIDELSDVSWFRQKYKEFQQSIGINIKPKQEENKGIRR